MNKEDDFFVEYYKYIVKWSALLSAVLDIKVYSFKESKQPPTIRYKFDSKGEIKYNTVNVYELSNLCKIWALEHECELVSSIRSKTGALCDIYSNKYNCKFTHCAVTEPYAIFKACLWLLEEIKKEKE